VQHSEPDVLALVALGESPSPTDAEHLRSCRECRDEVASFARVVQGVRVEAGGLAELATEPPVAPPARVWDAIAAGTGVTVAPRPERMDGGTGGRPLAAVPDLPGSLPSRSTAVTRPRRGGSRERSRLLLAVAASLVVGAAAGVAGTSLLQDRQDPPGQVVAQVDLSNLKKGAATGHAEVVRTGDGRRIRVDTTKLAQPQGGFYEVWLIDKQIKRMVGIGILHPGEDEFPVPNGVDLSQYPIVDISVQQPGDPKHSGDSVLRGTIES
jgi:hypothetical protein